MIKKFENNKRPRPLVLVVLDGLGVHPPYNGNAVSLAKTPFIDSLITEYPATTLRASGESVGLPWGEPGNSEVGHLTLGLGRILYQDLPRINKEISDNSFYKNSALKAAVQHVKTNNSKLHIMGVVSNGCVHASIDHLYALLILAKQNNLDRVYIHAILDGRDSPYDSGINFLKGIKHSIKENDIGDIATISGRFYTMDRNNNWDRVAKAYSAMVYGAGNSEKDPIEAIKKSYKKKIYDEEFVPTVIVENGQPVARIDDNDAVIFYNYRPDRARQITKAFVGPAVDKFKRQKRLNNLFFVGFT
ncbi:MAG: 2,3-bisphosphoglycerate-independent phosphoglycerate mutase, partial [Patescibacteria group bacterium]|nr:2,3-bisphosphoglycerate-independent phosphoglycerate mutase [Patescibacteria group bacterium]